MKKFTEDFKTAFGVVDVEGAVPKTLEVAAAEVAASFQAAWAVERPQPAPAPAGPPQPAPQPAPYVPQQRQPGPPAWAGPMQAPVQGPPGQAPAPGQAPVCGTCGTPMRWKQGVGKNGPYSGWVCPTPRCPEPPKWNR